MLLRLVMCVLLLFDRELLVQKKSSLLWVPFDDPFCTERLIHLSMHFPGVFDWFLGGPPFEVT